MKSWRQEEVEFLENEWGVHSLKSIAKNLGRSINAVKLKGARIGLSDARMSGDGITLNQLGKALGRDYNIVKSWLKHELPAKRKVFCNTSRVLFIGYKEFWAWAEQNKEKFNFALMEPNTLGPEPDWVKIKRKADQLGSQKTMRAVEWSKEENDLLLQLLKMPDITYPMIAHRINRSETAIKRRLYDLGIMLRPNRLNNHIKWTAEETKTLVEMAEAGYAYGTIARELGKSELATRGKLERMGFNFHRRKMPSC